MPKIKSEKTLTHIAENGSKSYTITPEMGVVSHFPKSVCEALAAKGAECVDGKIAKEK